jgi:thioredoxin reductase (NADPH)
MEYDVIIVGAGPAGLTAAIYSARYNLKTLVIGRLLGGKIGEAYEICNFPTYEKITGFEFSQKMVRQVKALGVEIKQEQVLDIEKKKKNFEVVTNKSKYFGNKIILTMGTERKNLGLQNEKELTGHGVSYCATCDAGFYKDKVVGVVGGGNSALTSALLLSEFAKKIYLFYRKDKFYRAEPSWVSEVKKNKKISVRFNSVVTKIIGKDKISEIEINGDKKMKVDGLFIEIGSEPNIELAEKLNLDLEKGYVKINNRQETSVKGIFVAGDITNNPLKQVITACAEGAIAADSAYKELRG